MEEGEGENDGSSAVLSHEISKISEYKMKIFGWRHEAFKSLQEPTIFSNKICSLKAQKVLATFFYNKFYRWLTTIIELTHEFFNLNFPFGGLFLILDSPCLIYRHVDTHLLILCLQKINEVFRPL